MKELTDKKLPELKGSGKAIAGQFKFKFKREQVENKTDDEIKQMIDEYIENIRNHLFELLKWTRQEWEKESAQFNKFIGKEH